MTQMTQMEESVDQAIWDVCSLIPTVLDFDSHIVMPDACPGIHAVQLLRLKKGESAPFFAKLAPLDGVDARTSAGHDGPQVDGSISRTIGTTSSASSADKNFAHAHRTTDV